MANSFYLKFLEQVWKKNIGWDDATVIRVMLERSTSVYVPDFVTHNYRSDLTGFVELTATGYSRQTLASKSVTINSGTAKLDMACGNVTYPITATNQIIRAVLGFVRIGGDDNTPNDDILAFRFDDDINNLFPFQLDGNGVVIPITRLFSTYQLAL